MDAPRELRMKVCVVGTGRVGKSSLIRRFVLHTFDERYIFTIGANVSKKVVTIPHPATGEPVTAVLMLWDIMGEKNFLDLLKDAYFRSASAVLAVADLTRPETFEDVSVWIGAVREITGKDIPVVMLGNKADLVPHDQLADGPLSATAAAIGAPHFATSAKTGDHVEEAFALIAKFALEREVRTPRIVA